MAACQHQARDPQTAAGTKSQAVCTHAVLQVLFNAPEGLARLQLEHQVRCKASTEAVLLLGTRSTHLVRCTSQTCAS